MKEPRSALGPGPEFDVIRRILEGVRARHAEWKSENVLVGPGDDCAVITGRNIAVSMDASIETVHFRRDWLSPEAMGYRATVAALSDLAATAATPIGVLAAVAVPPTDGAPFVEAIMAGVSAAAHGHMAMLLGGDLSASPGPVMIDIVVLGEVEQPVRRSGAAPGDEVWVTGDLGGAAAAVRAWSTGGQPPPAAFARFARPTPRIHEAKWLVRNGVLAAMIDVSDGLAGDAGHLAAASGVRVVLEESQIPVSDAARSIAADERDALALALGGGEDYELCYVTRAEAAMHIHANSFTQKLGTRVTRVGTVRAGSGVTILGRDGVERPLDIRGYSHFDPAGRKT